MEAQLGYLTAQACFQETDIISWDSGGASF